MNRTLSGAIAVGAPNSQACQQSELEHSHKNDYLIMLLRTRARLRGSYPAEIERKVLKITPNVW